MSHIIEDNRYDASDLPPAKNPFVYALRCLGKLFAIAFFGLGALLLGLIVLPILRLFVHPRERFKKSARRFISLTFRFFWAFLAFLHLARLTISAKEKETLKNLSSKIIVANHPSLLDVVAIISLVPNTDCIVNGALSRGIFAIIIKELYIVNTLGWEEMLSLSKTSLQNGANLIIFPEGTRTPRHGRNPYKRGAARIALSTNHSIVPIYIGGNDKYGLGKHDAFFSFNKEEPYLFSLSLLDEISMKDYTNLEGQHAARRITERIYESIKDTALKKDNRVL